MLTFDGRRILVAGMSTRLLWLDAECKILAVHSLEKPAAAVGLLPLGDRAVIAGTDGFVVGVDLRKAPSP
jgi:hypothetical protein